MSLLNPMDDDQLDAIIVGLERIKSLEEEIARLRLTDAERDVLEWCRQSCSNARTPQGDRLAAVLSGLLERLGVEK